jgi:hypothetical protein
LAWRNVVGKIQRFGISFDPILRLDKNTNDARIIVSADIVRGLDTIEWHHCLELTNEETAW